MGTDGVENSGEYDHYGKKSTRHTRFNRRLISVRKKYPNIKITKELKSRMSSFKLFRVSSIKKTK